MEQVRLEAGLSIRRLGEAFEESCSKVGRWVQESRVPGARKQRVRPVSGDEVLRNRVKKLCEEPRQHSWGHRHIRALLKRRYGVRVSRKTVLRIMDQMGLKQARIRYKPSRPKRVEKMAAGQPNEAWQIDMTSFQLSDLTPLYLVLVQDCCTRQVVGWTLDRRCRASEWVSAVRMALEQKGLSSKEACRGLTLRSDNGAQPCSKKFVEYLGRCGVQGQYTGYNAPDDNAYVERMIRTIKEEEIWPNLYDTFSEAWDAIDGYVRYYNSQRIHSSLAYQTPDEVAAQKRITLNAA